MISALKSTWRETMMLVRRCRDMLRGDSAAALIEDKSWPRQCLLVILLGSGCYGGSVGLWRSPLQGFFTALKFPLLVFLTCAGNAFLNGIVAQLTGSGLSFRQTSLAILTSLAVASCILFAMTPIALFVLSNTPPLTVTNAIIGHSVILVTHVLFIAYAGVVANLILWRFLAKVSEPRTARRTLFSWLAGNFLLGSQLAWVLRPFIGSPRLAVEFLRPDPLRGNFYEAVGRALKHLFF